MLAIGIGRARQTQFNWIVSGVAAAVNIALNFALIPRYGMMGAAVATARRLRRALRRDVAQLAAGLPRPVPVAARAHARSVAVALTVVGYELRSLPVAIALLASSTRSLLLPLGFYLPAERARLRRLVPLRG